MKMYVIEHLEGTDRHLLCYMCGNDATIVIEETDADEQTGTIDSTPFCDACYSKLTEEQVLN